MSSLAQIEANSANARHSTGPRSPAGKLQKGTNEANSDAPAPSQCRLPLRFRPQIQALLRPGRPRFGFPDRPIRRLLADLRRNSLTFPTLSATFIDYASESRFRNSQLTCSPRTTATFTPA